ncbi:acyl-CoA N-acyltransferase [Rhizopus microsporus var. microsporus]|uniref:N-acetyltransferase 9-like protein n=2 Tax=Rhizopus microsporus TaxID=58291 RepID=A0A2G4SIN4_RHIZD|nr:N-acetyltransferase 9 [Rhizopus microsporus ATCC 52813]ORE08189.1 acyl-CoA N-acyltransferase [Rhizopus microsporus var. microsporus]PHZ08634.1 N-acetyltransferase 9 [Rhizopus microsporus ATCC 52813]
MKINENLILIGQLVALVPYKPEHVPKYHEWMKSPFLQEMTASEPLSLEEEYEMQQSWHQDDKKLTFIITALPTDSPVHLKDIPKEEVKDKTVMIGDVNIFFNDPDDDPTFGEIEVMIAEADYRKTGRGREALRIMMGYAMEELGVKTFHAKISLKNEPSIQLFESKFGFYPVSVSEIFQETTLEWSLLDNTTSKDHERIIKVQQEILNFFHNHVDSITWQ